MKSILAAVAGFLFSHSFITSSHAVAISAGPSCGISAQDDSYFSVVGVQGAGIYPRQELRELENDSETWNLFIQAFARFQAMDQSEKLSYYQIAGIHGAPFGPWDNVKGEGLTGYCPHVSNLFGTWHRPYLALFEQILHDRAVEIAKEYPEGESRHRAEQAASKVRLPYWDWAIDPPNSTEGVMPASLRRPNATVRFPNGTSGEIPNPLLQYTFHPLHYDDFSALAEFQFKNWETTIRYPLDGYAVHATSRNDELNERIGAQQTNNRDFLYKILTMYQPFNEWSTKANGGKIGNMETLHDGVHNTFGLGHIGIVEVSAFDPVFWFHHCNIDRIMAIFQSRYPDTWVEDAIQRKATYTMPRNASQGPASPLAPFHMNAKGDMWTSTTSRNWTSFGYTYPELATNPSNDSLTLAINNLYKPATQGLNKNNTLATLNLDPNNRTADAVDWMAEVTMPSDIQITYSVRAFLGAPHVDPKNWPTDPNYVGQVASLSSPRMDSDVMVTANIVLTDKLAEKFKAGELKSLKKGDVAAYLKTEFHWRIQQVDLSEIPRTNPPHGLNVTVFCVPVHLPHSETEVPVWTGPFEYKPAIDGNPPDYDALPVPGAGSVNVTKPGEFNETSGGWNATSGGWSWNGTTLEGDE
ncbi:common central domain of tyrosinase-domain-containing protein [Massariosphaeria phaeospora]|uniref:tyrosinase n=1 Tax=Massariosphaeria phaeospora TaxID=100035 RepID=A0A7C8M196_9PLEO|nr:common central domain of tyrosinase-domain-containing protein [Massariosphaeria phaeospora]